jgi:hypothetical protein
MLLGVSAFGAGVAHMVAVTNVAFEAGRGYDARLAILLVIGVAVLVPGALLVWHGRDLLRDGRGSVAHVVGAAATLLAFSAILAPVNPGFGDGVILMAFVLGAIIGCLVWDRAIAAEPTPPSARQT